VSTATINDDNSIQAYTHRSAKAEDALFAVIDDKGKIRDMQVLLYIRTLLRALINNGCISSHEIEKARCEVTEEAFQRNKTLIEESNAARKV
jgi:hypothetical protein